MVRCVGASRSAETAPVAMSILTETMTAHYKSFQRSIITPPPKPAASAARVCSNVCRSGHVSALRDLSLGR